MLRTINYFAASLVCDKDGSMLCGMTYHSRTVFDERGNEVYKLATVKSTNTDVGWAYEQLAKLHQLPSANYSIQGMEAELRLIV